MRWLIVGFVVSLAALIFASGGIAWHIWRQHKKPAAAPPSQGGSTKQASTHEDIFEPEEAP